MPGRDVNPAYFDFAASARMLPAAVEAMASACLKYPQNPNSLHFGGREAMRALEDAREKIASLLGASRPSEIVFTSGGTESDVLALLGMAEGMPQGKDEVLVSEVEHHAVLNCASTLSRTGRKMLKVPVSSVGVVEGSSLQERLSKRVALVSIMAANNEVGVVQDIPSLAALAHSCGALFHTDAVQAVCGLAFDCAKSGVDAASFSAHKFAGPRGFGLLYLRGGASLRPLMVGGGQEGGLRGGTQNLAGALSTAVALEEAVRRREEYIRHTRELQLALLGRLDKIGRIHVICDPREGSASYLPGIVSFCIEGMESELAVLKLDDMGFEVSGGAACSSGNADISHVLKALRVPEGLAQGQLRVSFGLANTLEEVDALACVLEVLCGGA